MSTAADTASDEPLVVGPDSIEVEERRRHERLNTYLRVRWEGLLGCHEGTVSDISAGGCFILTESHTALRELIRLELELHTGSWVKIWGEVTNQFPGVGFGVRYTEVDEEDEDKFSLSLGQARLMKSAVAALKKVNGYFVGRGGEELPPERLERREYKAKLVLALHKVNKALLDLPECQKKTALRLSVQTYADLYRVWAAMPDGAGVHPNPKGMIEAYRCLKDKYGAPPEVLEGFRRGEVHTIINFLRRKASLSLSFAS
jgi:PilZ domain